MLPYSVVISLSEKIRFLFNEINSSILIDVFYRDVSTLCTGVPEEDPPETGLVPVPDPVEPVPGAVPDPVPEPVVFPEESIPIFVVSIIPGDIDVSDIIGVVVAESS